ncbi:MAG TPA: PH domain-containing protein [Myxococcales bacterium]|nr:PH domain-containing protein [Myxococcales bacterium]
MSTQLRVVPAEATEPVPLAAFRTDARLRLWGAGACACGSIAMTAVGYQRTVAPVLAGPVAAAFLLWSLYMLATFVSRRAVRYTLTAQRLEVERGILGKRYESIDLWRVRDMVLEQTLFERMRGVGRITVLSSDQAEPELLVGPVAGARPLYDRLRDAVALARKEARVVPLG